jgi:hypothetical protein
MVMNPNKLLPENKRSFKIVIMTIYNRMRPSAAGQNRQPYPITSLNPARWLKQYSL